MQKTLFIMGFILLLLAFSSVCIAENEALDRQRSHLLTEKGLKAEKRGEIEEAVTCFEDAYSAYPKLILPLLHWTRVLCRIGMYDRADKLLEPVPVNKLSGAGRCEVFLLRGQIAVFRGSVEKAAIAYSKALKASEKNDTAKINLAMVNQVIGNSSRAEELINDYKNFLNMGHSSRVAFILDLYHGNFGRAYNTAGEFHTNAKGSRDFLSSIVTIQPVFFMLNLPLGMSGLTGILYYVFIFSGLVFMATRFSATTALWHGILFVVMATAMMISIHSLIEKDMLMAFMSDNYSVHDPVWIIPRLLISGHFVALALYFIFPMFAFLPEKQRPRSYEYYGIWFFCCFFMVFVLTFQGRLPLGIRAAYVVGSLFLSILSSFCVPLGRLALFKVGSVFGFNNVVSIDRGSIQSNESIGFTDAKILEAKALKLLEKDDFEEVILISKKVLNSVDKKLFPSLWKTFIYALILQEDYLEAKKQTDSFLEVLKGTNSYYSGQLYDSLQKSLKGDFAGALKIVKGLSETNIRSFSANETALSLLILGRCSLFYKDNVQAHIDLGKAFNTADIPSIKIEALIELVELDFNMSAFKAMDKSRIQAEGISGGARIASLKNTIFSIVAAGHKKMEAAMELAKKACQEDLKCSRSLAWYGHLLCQDGKQREAEALLENMPPGSYDANRLMVEVIS